MSRLPTAPVGPARKTRVPIASSYLSKNLTPSPAPFISFFASFIYDCAKSPLAKAPSARFGIAGIRLAQPCQAVPQRSA
jgi:hypothetical protein